MSPQSRFLLDGRTALVTGGSRGIGRSLVLALAEAGANVAIHCASRRTLAETAAAEATRFGVRAAVFEADLADARAVGRLHAEVVAALGAPDVLVLNASVQFRTPWREITADAALLQLEVNLVSSLRLIQLCEPAMAARKWGRILTLGSVQERRPHPDMAVYSASKSAQANLVASLARQLAPGGITVNNLAPGVITTDRNREALADEDYAEQVRARIPVGRFGTPEDCAGAALLLCSEAGAYITGQSLYVDGGMSL
jgi:NAD(P)-dependent dehydrogenase (short-subunit alcohol dehydrogenase family)